MADLTREQASPWGELGDQRYVRYVTAFDRVMQAISDGYHLEAIAILDSLISDRLHSRLSYNYNGIVLDTPKFKAKFRSCGNLCRALLKGDSASDPGIEAELDFREVIEAIEGWVKQRNSAMHGTSKILRSQENQKGFYSILESYRQTAHEGVKLLQQFDVLDRNDRQRNNAAVPATYPYAFFPEERASLLRRRR